MKNAIIYLIFILSAVLSSAGNNQFLPLVSNFSDSDYGAQLQNWCAEIDDDGIIYIGNNEGLLTFDGYSWECTALPRGTIVRSLLYDNGRLYVGTFEDFGYFERNEQGEMTYISLAKETKAVSLENEEIWQISRLGRHIYFQSFANIFVYEPESNVLSTLPARIAERPDIEGDGNMKPLFSYVICGHLYVQRTNGSFYRFEHGGWRRYWPMKSFGSHIMGVLLPDNAPSAAEEIPDGTLVFTQDHLFQRKSTTISGTVVSIASHQQQTAPYISELSETVFSILTERDTCWNISTPPTVFRTTLFSGYAVTQPAIPGLLLTMG